MEIFTCLVRFSPLLVEIAPSVSNINSIDVVEIIVPAKIAGFDTIIIAEDHGFSLSRPLASPFGTWY